MKLTPYIHLMRLDKPIGIWLLFFPAAWGVALAGGNNAGLLMLLMLIGATITRSAGCIINDLADRKLDAQVERTKSRPLVSGAIKPRQAIALLIALLIMAFAITRMLPGTVLILALIALPMIAAYPWMKRITWWPQVFLGLTFNLGALMGWVATGAPLSAAAYWLYAACVFWTLGYDTLYALQDMADDKIAGIKSTARILTESKTLKRITRLPLRVFIQLCYAFMVWCFYQACIHANAMGPATFVAGIVVGWFGCGHYAVNACLAAAGKKPVEGGRLFRHNQWLGLVLLMAILIEKIMQG